MLSNEAVEKVFSCAIVPRTNLNIKVEQRDDILECMMARYKRIDTSPRFLAVDLSLQLLPGSFEHALDYLIDNELDLSAFDTRYKNDKTGACAYSPAILHEVILFAYSQGIVATARSNAPAATTLPSSP